MFLYFQNLVISICKNKQKADMFALFAFFIIYFPFHRSWLPQQQPLFFSPGYFTNTLCRLACEKTTLPSALCVMLNELNTSM